VGRPASGRLISPMGATSTELLVHMNELLREGILLHLEAGGLHLFRLSSNRRALVYEDVGRLERKRLRRLLLVAIVSMTPWSETGVEIAVGPPPHGRTLRLLFSQSTERDTFIAGLGLMVRGARRGFERGFRLVRAIILRRAFSILKDV
jgi:hypothetical protein